MATVNEVKNQLQTQPQVKGLKDLIKSAAMELGKALPQHMSPERIVRIALTAVNTNPELSRCTPNSFMGSLFVLAQIGLEPIAGRAYLLPFNNKRKVDGQWKTLKEVQALVGYKGLIELFYRHESALSIDMQTHHANDEFDYQYGTEPYLRHKPNYNDRGEVVGYYAVARLRGGAAVFKYMTAEECMDHGRKHSKTYNKNNGEFSSYSPWSTDPESMCKKTVLIQLAKVLPLSVELQRAISVDETSRDYRKGLKNALDAPVTTEWKENGNTVDVEANEPEKADSGDSEGIPEGDPNDFYTGDVSKGENHE